MAGHSFAPPAADRSRRRGLAAAFAVLGLLACGGLLMPAPALAQYMTFPTRPAPPAKSKLRLQREKAGEKQMLVQADRIDYDNANRLVSAIGNVQIYYSDSTLEADKVIYNQATKRLHAEGNVRLTDADGRVTYGSIMDLSDDYRNGFVDALRLDAPDETRFAAARAERSAGNFTIFHNGVYTACEPCKDNPKAPPEWQVKAKRIIHDQTEKMIYFEDAYLQFWGHSLAWMPYFSAPDPTVKRKTGFLMPSVSSSSIYGVGFEIPYYWALAPDYDITLAPKFTTTQGVLMQGEFRQRLINGAYQIRASGIHQQDKEYYGTSSSAYRDWRGSVETAGQFALNTKWTWGWNALLLSDKYYLLDYAPSLSAYRQNPENLSVTSEGISQLYLTGRGSRSYFDARSIYYLGFSPSDNQTQIPVIHPVIDYDYTVGHPVLGGELSYSLNFTSLTRNQANFDPITTTALNNGSCSPTTADPAVKADCVLHGIPGTYSRFTAEAKWRRSFTDSIGQVFTPFASLRADAGSMQINNDPNVSDFIPDRRQQSGARHADRRLRVPLPLHRRAVLGHADHHADRAGDRAAERAAGRQMAERGRAEPDLRRQQPVPRRQVLRLGPRRGRRPRQLRRGIYRPVQQGRLRQRVYSASPTSCSERTPSRSTAAANTGLDSGLDTTASDYVGRLSYQPDNILTFSSRYRFDHQASR